MCRAYDGGIEADRQRRVDPPKEARQRPASQLLHLGTKPKQNTFKRKQFKYVNHIYNFQTKHSSRNQIASVNFVCHWKTTKVADFVCVFGLPCRAYRP